MKKPGSAKSNTETTLDRLTAEQHPPYIWFVVLLLFYAAATVGTMWTSSAEGVTFLFGQPVPYRSVTGAFSALGNLSIVLLVVFYKKQGFIVSLIILLGMFPNLLRGMIVQHNMNNISGLATNTLILVAIILLYSNSRKLQKYQTRLRDQAVTDRVTGLPNEFACTELMEELVKRGEPFAVAAMKLNYFKRVNNTMGQNTGLKVLAAVVERWRSIADGHRSGTLDFLTVQSVDEFVLVIREFGAEEDIRRTIDCYQDAVQEKITIDDTDYFLSACFGYAVYPADAADVETLQAAARGALALARSTHGTEMVRRFTPDMLDAQRVLETERRLRAALEDGRMQFHLQPQYDMEHRLIGFETLARVLDADGGVAMNPGDFIPVAEQMGLIDKIDYTVFREAAVFFSALLKKTGRPLTLSVNVSVRYLMKNSFIDEVREILDVSGVPARQVQIEITESIMIESVEKALQRVSELKAMGISIAIDDFGTGYSSLSYLSSFPADQLKVDKSFIDQMNTGDEQKQYVATIISIGHVMKFDVIAEGVEEPAQLETLKSIGCDYIQGFIWGRPLSPAEAEALALGA